MKEGEDARGRNKQEQYNEYQYQTILNLYNSGIPDHIIAFQLDIDEEGVQKVIKSASNNNNTGTSSPFAVPLLRSTSDKVAQPLDHIIDTEMAIKNAQVRMWKALRAKPDITLSMERTNEVLKALSKSKTILVILNIDLVDSTELSISLPLERLSIILQTFMQEAASVIISYGGYVLKYIGDAVLGFFVVPNRHVLGENVIEYQDENANPNSLQIPCINAINCGRSIIKILDQAINPILDQYGYPEISVRVGIDVGENVVIQDGWDIHRLHQSKNREMDEAIVIREPHFDIIGYSTNIAVKMTELANTNGIVIGQSIYEALDQEKSSFKLLDVNPEVWKYIDNRTDALYRIYQNT